MELQATSQFRHVQFGNPKFQDRVDGLSMRAQGKPEQVQQVEHTIAKPKSHSQMQANFSSVTDL